MINRGSRGVACTRVCWRQPSNKPLSPRSWVSAKMPVMLNMERQCGMTFVVQPPKSMCARASSARGPRSRRTNNDNKDLSTADSATALSTQLVPMMFVWSTTKPTQRSKQGVQMTASPQRLSSLG